MITLFVGPSLPRARVLELTEGIPCSILEPAAQGDLYRAVRKRPRAIGLVDGYFDRVPAVWHKEILWALQEGIPVVGGGSMGALRAAELHPFGMIGVGAIFEAFARGELVRDDEVALMHGDASSGYRPLSEPLVNVRATLARAEREGIVSRDIHARGLALAAARFYPDRSLRDLCRLLEQEGFDVRAFAAWWPTGRVDQKAIDATLVVRATSALGFPDSFPLPAELEAHPRSSNPEVSSASFTRTSTEPSWTFEHTAMWEELVRVHGGSTATAHPHAGETVVSTLKERTEDWDRTKVAALGRWLAADMARSRGKHVDAEEILAALTRLRRERRLDSPESLGLWMQKNSLDERALAELLASQVRVDWLAEHLEGDLEPHVLDHLKLSDAYSP